MARKCNFENVWVPIVLLFSKLIIGQEFIRWLSWKIWIHGLKTVAFIAGKKDPAIQKKFIRFSIENLIANISFYGLNWILDAISPLKSFLKLYFNGKRNKKFLDRWIFFTSDKCNCFLWEAAIFHHFLLFSL